MISQLTNFSGEPERTKGMWENTLADTSGTQKETQAVLIAFIYLLPFNL